MIFQNSESSPLGGFRGAEMMPEGRPARITRPHPEFLTPSIPLIVMRTRLWGQPQMPRRGHVRPSSLPPGRPPHGLLTHDPAVRPEKRAYSLRTKHLASAQRGGSSFTRSLITKTVRTTAPQPRTPQGKLGDGVRQRAAPEGRCGRILALSRSVRLGTADLGAGPRSVLGRAGRCGVCGAASLGSTGQVPGAPPPGVTTRNVPRRCPMSPGGRNRSWVANHCYK